MDNVQKQFNLKLSEKKINQLGRNMGECIKKNKLI